jgi:signal transduction histidine kinase
LERKEKEALEGKKYVEEYIHSFTHEIKSPLSAIRGAAELLGEEMDPQKQAHFLENIRNEASRIQNIVDRMLELSKLESLDHLEKKGIPVSNDNQVIQKAQDRNGISYQIHGNENVSLREVNSRAQSCGLSKIT